MLVTASVDGFKVWDIRNPFQPVYVFQKLFEGWNTTMDFVIPCEKFIVPSILLGTDENSVRLYDLKDYSFTRFREGNDSGNIWVSYCQSLTSSIWIPAPM